MDGIILCFLFMIFAPIIGGTIGFILGTLNDIFGFIKINKDI